ncbi:MAG: ABC transporter substrate-binding protein [Pirellulaceae bacterium]|nr:ABC transporter substrate-binding protein [Pirellulaceae bacterium]
MKVSKAHTKIPINARIGSPKSVRGCAAVSFAPFARLLIACFFPMFAVGQDEAEAEAEDPPELPEVRLLEQDPFDLITLDETNKKAQLRVYPISFPGGRPPANPNPADKIKFRLIKDDKEYEVFWRNILRYEPFDVLLLQEAERLRNAKNFDEAFEYYLLCQSSYPSVPGLARSINQYLYLDAANLTQNKDYPAALAVLEELYDRDKDFRFTPNARSVMSVMGTLLNVIITRYENDDDYGSMRQIITRVVTKYGADRPPTIDEKARKLAALAAEKREEARELVNNRRYHDAISASKEMMDIWPHVQGAKELNAWIVEQFPQVNIGVTQPAISHNAQRLENWGARRTGMLLHRTLVEFKGAGNEGGQYTLSLGAMQRSNDYRKLTLNLKQFTDDEDSLVTGYQVAQRLLDLANPKSPNYSAAWGGVMSAAKVKDVMQVELELRQPHVLPEALLRIPLVPVNDDTAALGNGLFEVSKRDSARIHYKVKGFEPGQRLAEIVEHTFEDTQLAMSALRRGDVDVVDRLFPADAARLSAGLGGDDEIAIEQYALPTIHMLLISSDNPFLANRDFRRAFIFAIHRELILKQELLGNRDIPGCQLISGPFAAGVGDRDPLAYAYDITIEPRGYFPRLGKLLMVVAQREVEEMAKKKSEPKPELTKFVLGHPAYESARLACQAIAAHLNIIDVEIELKQFPPGVTRDPDNEADLTYAEVAIWEPLVDARRLLGQEELQGIDSPYMKHALRNLDAAQTWGDVRDRLLDLHRTAHNEAAVIPLWQMVDSFAYRKQLRNIVGTDGPPVWLYQNIDQWRLSASGNAE